MLKEKIVSRGKENEMHSHNLKLDGSKLRCLYTWTLQGHMFQTFTLCAGAGLTLSQYLKGNGEIVTIPKKTFNACQRNCCVTRTELLQVVPLENWPYCCLQVWELQAIRPYRRRNGGPATMLNVKEVLDTWSERFRQLTCPVIPLTTGSILSLPHFPYNVLAQCHIFLGKNVLYYFVFTWKK